MMAPGIVPAAAALGHAQMVARIASQVTGAAKAACYKRRRDDPRDLV
jgi:hypothetical protein